MPEIIDEIKKLQTIKITSHKEKYNKDTILIDTNIFYRQYKNAFILAIDLHNGDNDSISFYLKHILDNLTITQPEFLDRLKTIQPILERYK